MLIIKKNGFNCSSKIIKNIS